MKFEVKNSSTQIYEIWRTMVLVKYMKSDAKNSSGEV